MKKATHLAPYTISWKYYIMKEREPISIRSKDFYIHTKFAANNHLNDPQTNPTLLGPTP
jgi:hypothetical protein